MSKIFVAPSKIATDGRVTSIEYNNISGMYKGDIVNCANASGLQVEEYTGLSYTTLTLKNTSFTNFSKFYLELMKQNYLPDFSAFCKIVEMGKEQKDLYSWKPLVKIEIDPSQGIDFFEIIADIAKKLLPKTVLQNNIDIEWISAMNINQGKGISELTIRGQAWGYSFNFTEADNLAAMASNILQDNLNVALVKQQSKEKVC